MPEKVYCARCSRGISEAELEDGLVVETEKGFFCADCATYVKEPPAPREESETAEVQREIRSIPSERGGGPVTEQAAARDLKEEEQPAPQEDDPLLLLQQILNELKPISRAVLYEKASVWNLLGGMGQIFALALVLVAVIHWGSHTMNILLAAIALQLMTLTCFLRGK
jgi:hypothetical protein